MEKHNLEFCVLNPESINSLKITELAGRTCYKSEERIKEGSELSFNNMLCNTYKHLSVMEHSIITVWFRGSRGFTHEMVRHRHCSFSQESTRYCNYGKKGGLNIVSPEQYVLLEKVMKQGELSDEDFAHRLDRVSDIFHNSYVNAQESYLNLLDLGVPVQLARDVLPIGTKADIVVSGNYRTWVELLRQRLTKQAHPIMRAMMTPLANMLKEKVPVVFDSLVTETEDSLIYAKEITLDEYLSKIGGK